MSKEIDAPCVNRRVLLDGLDERMKKVRSVTVDQSPASGQGVGRHERDPLIARQVLPGGHRPLAVAAIAVQKDDQWCRPRGRLSRNQELISALMTAEADRAGDSTLARRRQKRTGNQARDDRSAHGAPAVIQVLVYFVPWCNAKNAPCGSCSTEIFPFSPMSIGPMTTFAPSDLAFAVTAAVSATST